MKLANTIALCFLMSVGLAETAKSQDVSARAKDFRIVFEDIQHGFELCDVAAFASHLGPQVQVSIKGEQSGYYSSNQAYYILEGYLKMRKVVSFEFTNVGETEATPYATGSAVFTHKGNRETEQVYVALMKSDERWVLSEIKIY